MTTVEPSCGLCGAQDCFELVELGTMGYLCLTCLADVASKALPLRLPRAQAALRYAPPPSPQLR